MADGKHRVIEMTEEELLEANFKALGLDAKKDGMSPEQRMIEELPKMIRELGRLVSSAELGSRVGVSPNTACGILRRLAHRGEVLVTRNGRTGKLAYVPNVIGKGE